MEDSVSDNGMIFSRHIRQHCSSVDRKDLEAESPVKDSFWKVKSPTLPSSKSYARELHHTHPHVSFS